MTLARVGLGGWLIACCCWPAISTAHTLSETHSARYVVGATVDLTFTVPDQEASRLSPAGTSPTDQLVGDYMARHLRGVHVIPYAEIVTE